MTINVGDTVRLLRKRVREPGSSTDPTHCQMWHTINLDPCDQKIGLVVQGAGHAGQVSVLCGGKMKYWFLKNVEKVNDGR